MVDMSQTSIELLSHDRLAWHTRLSLLTRPTPRVTHAERLVVPRAWCSSSLCVRAWRLYLRTRLLSVFYINVDNFILTLTIIVGKIIFFLTLFHTSGNMWYLLFQSYYILFLIKITTSISFKLGTCKYIWYYETMWSHVSIEVLTIL